MPGRYRGERVVRMRRRPQRRTLALLIALAVGAYTWWTEGQPLGADSRSTPPAATAEQAGVADDSVRRAFEARLDGVQVHDEGVVLRVLPDDRDGSRHQRFVLRVRNGPTVLVAHNIDLAPRIGSLREGDVVAFYGEYEWSNRGGVVHWTHHDPAGRHPDGWLRHKGRIYQ